ncbi:MAG: hypothetical protein H7Z71_03660 [Moraxellaceae bacterium]|nr:hypothetical protein [Pseudobdellovibrionaceae bacterium]
MQSLKVIKNIYFKVLIAAISLMIFGFVVYSLDSVQSKSQRISFPGITHISLNRSAKDLRLSKVHTTPDARLIENLVARQIKLNSALFLDPQIKLMVAIGENLSDQQLVFVVIKNNQVTQIQKINEITNKYISLQYGKISIDNPTATASSTAAFETL